MLLRQASPWVLSCGQSVFPYYEFTFTCKSRSKFNILRTMDVEQKKTQMVWWNKFYTYIDVPGYFKIEIWIKTTHVLLNINEIILNSQMFTPFLGSVILYKDNRTGWFITCCWNINDKWISSGQDLSWWLINDNHLRNAKHGFNLSLPMAV